MSETRVNWKAVIIFYIIACAIAWPFFYMRAVNPDALLSLPIPLFFLPSSYMWGPGIAALIVFFLFRSQHKRTISIFGGSIGYSLMFFFIPLIVWAIATAVFQESLPDFLEGAFIGEWMLYILAVFVNIFGEELGWRGFLQDALRPLKFTPRFLLLGTMWELWHAISRLYQNPDATIAGRILLALFLLLLLIGTTFIIGIAVERTLSVIVAVTFHAWLNLNFEMPFMTTWIIFALSIPFWIYMIRTWPVRRLSEQLE